MLGNPKDFRFRIFCSYARKLRRRRIEGRAKITRRLAGLAVASDTIVQIEFSASDQSFIGPRQRAFQFWGVAANGSMDAGIKQSSHVIGDRHIGSDIGKTEPQITQGSENEDDSPGYETSDELFHVDPIRLLANLDGSLCVS